MCGFVLYQTQVIIEKRRNGDISHMDFVTHSLGLFMGFADIFRHIVIILLENVLRELNFKSCTIFLFYF